MIAEEVTGCYGEKLVAMATSMWPIVVKVADYNVASIPILNMPKIYNLIMVAKDITGCYGKILVAMVTSM